MGTTPRAQIAALLPLHLDSGYNLARWLTGNDQDAQDVVQEASMRALSFASTYRGENGRAWFLSIVRNTCYTWMKQHRNRNLSLTESIDEEPARAQASVEDMVIQRLEAEILVKAIAALPTEFREALVLREIEELTYKEISHVLQIPLGTVMSRLARARERLLQTAKGAK